MEKMTSVNLDTESGELNLGENTNAFTGSTIYGYKLKKSKNKRINFFGLFVRILVIISILSLMAITVTLSIQVNKYKIIMKTNKDLKVTSSFKKTYCEGLVYDNNCFIFYAIPKTFDEALYDCNLKNYFLPPISVMSSWISNYLEDTWSEEGTGLLKNNNGLLNTNNIDVSTEMRKYFCVKSF
ncbi:122R [Yaba monkey tumor virus]|uniref:Protein OPG161 n=1 Tax=Yaba monkey tumor virus (strain VR587) TaxID=928314 RepID=Q6TUP7_YMTV5|nr:EEV glycoprotein [Yaba monkey tumor virus]AAR07479.1 122R [Yaba monkey tumor virus]